MKITIYERNGRIMARAMIPISKKHGILKRRQKTWTVIERCNVSFIEEVRPMVMQEAKRWQQKTLAKLFGHNEAPMLEVELL